MVRNIKFTQQKYTRKRYKINALDCLFHTEILNNLNLTKHYQEKKNMLLPKSQCTGCSYAALWSTQFLPNSYFKQNKLTMVRL